MNIYAVQPDSKLLLVPLIYFLPENLIEKFPTLRSFPRNMWDVMHTGNWLELLDSDIFLNEIMEAMAMLAFPRFGFRGRKEDYTADFPFWKLSYLTFLWAGLLERETGWGLQAMFLNPSRFEYSFFDPEIVKTTMKHVVKKAIEEQGWQGMIDVLREMPCEEDFVNRETNVRKDFTRKWYHERTRTQMVSLEEGLETGSIGKIAKPIDFVDDVAARDSYDRFKTTLTKRDTEILEMRVAGFTYEEIAEKLGYKNHSGVQKRMQTLSEMFADYR